MPRLHHGRDEVSLNTAVKDLCAKFGERVFGIPGDMTDPAVIEAAFSAVQRRWGSLEILIANLGSGTGKTGWEQEPDRVGESCSM